MPYNEIHLYLIDMMYGMLAIATFIIIERVIYYSASLKEGKWIEEILQKDLSDKKILAEIKARPLAKKAPQSQMMYELIKGLNKKTMPFDALTSLVQTIYFSRQTAVSRYLWVIETITILAPLFGLLGTICGIIETFHSLAAAGNSDPSGVSKGIGDALFATGVGIAIAIYGLTFYNYFSHKVSYINNQMKMISMFFLSHRDEGDES